MRISIDLEPLELRELIQIVQQPSTPTPVRSQRTVSRGEIRAWAKANKLPVSSRGNIAKDVVEAYYYYRELEQ